MTVEAIDEDARQRALRERGAHQPSSVKVGSKFRVDFVLMFAKSGVARRGIA